MVETEVIMIHNNDNIYSHVFVTSNLPIFFRNKSSYTQRNIIKAFNGFFRGLIEEYNLLVMIGLNDQGKDKQFFDIFKNFVIANVEVLEKRLSGRELRQAKTPEEARIIEKSIELHIEFSLV